MLAECHFDRALVLAVPRGLPIPRDDFLQTGIPDKPNCIVRRAGFGWDAGHCYSRYTQEVPEEYEEEMYNFMYNSDIECERVCVPSILLDWGIDVVVCECGC